MRNLILVLTIVISAISAPLALAQNKMDLDDLQIKGELHNDDRLRMLAREQNDLKNYVKYRTNYRAEMVEGLPRPEPQVQYELRLWEE